MTATMNTSQGVPQDMPGDEYYTMTLEKENTSKVLVPSSQTDEKLPYPENDSAAENDSGHEYNDDIDGTSGLGSSQRDIISGDDDESCDYSGPHKLFVGQVPRNMEEQDLFPIFKKFGPMEDVVVIRDKHTGQHRGCAFVTFLNKESADDCESELHDQFVMPGGKRPVQIRPAGYKDETENKIFVGMLPRNIQEDLVKQLFSPFGEIVGVYLIRSTDGIKKGCAFVKFAHHESAIAAIRHMHDAITVEGSDRPLIVKFADTRSQKREKARNMHHVRYDTYAHSNGGSHANSTSTDGNIYYIPAGPPVHIYAGHSPPINMGTHHHGTTPSFSSQGPYSNAYAAHSAPPPSLPPNFMYQQVSPYDPFLPQGAIDIQDDTFSRIPRPSHRHASQQHDIVRPREGPAGANLFIYHLPHDLTDADLATAFNPFGNVISAKVFVDRFSGESKGFGFVSYDSVISAELAIEQMNGFQIGSKRLKVQHKRVNHRPPMATPYYPAGPMQRMPIYDVPHAIEISSEGEDTETGGYTNSTQSSHLHVNQMNHDMNLLSNKFNNLRTGYGHDGNYVE